METTYKQLQAQAQQLLQEAEKARLIERQAVIASLREQMSAHGITNRDLGYIPKVKAERAGLSRRSTGRVAPKYRDNNGNAWTGRGRCPRWLTAAIESGKPLSDFAV